MCFDVHLPFKGLAQGKNVEPLLLLITFFPFLWNKLELLCSRVNKYMQRGKMQLSGISVIVFACDFLNFVTLQVNVFFLCQLKP